MPLSPEVGARPPSETELNGEFSGDMIDLFPSFSTTTPPTLHFLEPSPAVGAGATGFLEGTYCNEGTLARGADGALSVQVEDGRAAVARRPRENARVGVEVKVAAVVAIEAKVEVDLVNAAR